ncbi:hypothetical protein NHX12_021829, partial [Muraenolepis orangiensis]
VSYQPCPKPPTVLPGYQSCPPAKPQLGCSSLAEDSSTYSTEGLGQQASNWPSWYGVQEDLSMEEPSTTQPPAEGVSVPPYSECAQDDDGPRPTVSVPRMTTAPAL